MRYQPQQQAAAAAAKQQQQEPQQPSSNSNASGSATGSAGGGSSCAPPLEASSACARGLQHDLSGGVDWEWLAGLLRSQRYGPVLRVDLDAGTADGLLPAQYECHDRLMAQVTGRRRVLLLSPEQAFDGLYPYPTHHTYDTYSMVDLEAPDAGLWPKFGRVRGVTAILAPGDVLYVPAFW